MHYSNRNRNVDEEDPLGLVGGCSKTTSHKSEKERFEFIMCNMTQNQKVCNRVKTNQRDLLTLVGVPCLLAANVTFTILL